MLAVIEGNGRSTSNVQRRKERAEREHICHGDSNVFQRRPPRRITIIPGMLSS